MIRTTNTIHALLKVVNQTRYRVYTVECEMYVIVFLKCTTAKWLVDVHLRWGDFLFLSGKKGWKLVVIQVVFRPLCRVIGTSLAQMTW